MKGIVACGLEKKVYLCAAKGAINIVATVLRTKNNKTHRYEDT